MMRKQCSRSRIAWFAGTVAALAFSVGQASAQDSWFRGIGDIPGGHDESVGMSISADGSTVVGHSAATDGRIEGCRWRLDTGLTSVGSANGITRSLARGASRDGAVVVGYLKEGKTEQAFVWTAALGLRRLGFLLGGDQSCATAIAASGNVAVGFSRSPAGIEAVRATFVSGMQSLGDLAGGATSAVAFGVSDNGSVVVGVGTTASGRQGFRWNEGGGMQAVPGTVGGSAVCVSGNGTVIAGAVPGAAGFEAFKWTAGGGLVQLGDLPGGAYQSEAIALSADGATIVGAGHDTQGGAAFIWDRENGMRSIRRELARVPQADGWKLICATGVSADGRTVTGIGVNPGGRREGWVARLPLGCAVDWDRSGLVDSLDMFAFMFDFQTGDADFDNDGQTNSVDFLAFVTAFPAGCG